MELTFAPRDILQIDDARLVFKNFSGAPSLYNKEGERNFALVIPNQEIADALMANTNENGDGWNVKVRPPREEGDDPFIYLPVKVNFTEYGPNVYLKSGEKMIELDEDSVGMLDSIDIQSVDLDIRPYDWVRPTGEHGRTAYLQSIHVIQKIDRFAARYIED